MIRLKDLCCSHLRSVINLSTCKLCMVLKSFLGTLNTYTVVRTGARQVVDRSKIMLFSCTCCFRLLDFYYRVWRELFFPGIQGRGLPRHQARATSMDARARLPSPALSREPVEFPKESSARDVQRATFA